MPGWLPLAKGLPALLSDHLDRSAKQLLRGREATIDDWVEDEEEADAGEDGEERTLTRIPRMVVLDSRGLRYIRRPLFEEQEGPGASG